MSAPKSSPETEMLELQKNIKNMIDVEFVNNRKMFEESWKNFDLIAPYCKSNFDKVRINKQFSERRCFLQ